MCHLMTTLTLCDDVIYIRKFLIGSRGANVEWQIEIKKIATVVVFVFFRHLYELRYVV